MAQWVQHKSGIGEKWEVDSNISGSDEEWCVKTKRAMHRHFIPKSEYIPCEPPEQWEDISARIEVQGNTHCWDPVEQMSWLALPSDKYGYRLRQVRLCWPESLPAHGKTIGDYQWAFVVERRKP